MKRTATCCLCGDPVAPGDLACGRCEAEIESEREALDRTRRVCEAAECGES